MAGIEVTWQVTSQTVDQTTNDAAGNTLVGSYIYYQTGRGNTGVVFVPKNLLTEDHVKKVIHEDAKTLDTIGLMNHQWEKG
jgi:hypothetical protein